MQWLDSQVLTELIIVKNNYDMTSLLILFGM